MMRIYESLKNLMIPELLSQAAVTLGESGPKVTKAANMILPALLGRLLKEGPTAKIKEVTELASTHLVVNNLQDVFEGHGIFGDLNIGERFENAMIGSKNTKFRAAVARHTGISIESADRLTNWVSATIAGYFGNEVLRGNEALPGMLKRLKDEKEDFLHDIPHDLASILGISSLVGTPAAAHAGAHEPEKKKCRWGWLLWLILGLLVLGLLLCWWRSCCRDKAKTGTCDPKTELVADARQWEEVKLPDGNKIRILKGSLEEKLINYLNSNEFKNATEDQLKDKWFHIETIEFKFGSSTELISGSTQHLSNFEAILKAYPVMKIRLAGYADKVGGNAANLTLSEARANFIKSEMEKSGVKDQIFTHGFGNEFAVYPADAPDSLRSRDRDIALRFMK